MRAFALEQSGEPGSLRDLPDPQPAEGEILVRVKASSLNAMDWKVARGFLKDWMEHHFPLVLGQDFSGVVEGLGAGVTEFQTGEAVFGATGKRAMGSGTLGELATVSAASTAAKPDSLDDAVAASLPVAGCTALEAVDAVSPGAGDATLVVGASGGVGSFAVQLAVARGARVVGVAAASNADYLRQLGAAEVIDYTSQDVAEAARRLQPEGFAAIIDVVSDAETLARLSALVRDGGSVVSALGAAPGEGQSRVRGVNLGGTVTRENLQAIAAAVERGEVKPPEIKKLSLEQAGEGLNDLASGHSRGKWVVVVG